MTNWLAIFIPIVVAILLLVFFRKSVVWWEVSLLIAPSALLILGLNAVMISSRTSDTEYFGSTISYTIYYEAWDEEVPCTHSYDCNCSTDKDGHETCSTCYRHSYDVDYHPKRWAKRDNLGNEFNISESEFNSLQARFGTKSYFVELNRDYHSIDGNAYYVDWNKLPETSDNMTTEHSYENKVKASHSIFKFEDIDEKTKSSWNLYDYPEVINNYQSIVLGMSTNEITSRKLQYINGHYGSLSQFRTYILFFKNQSIETAFKQKSYWEGGNKNEFVICIGIDSLNKYQWCKCFSWMDKPDLEVRVESYFNNIPNSNKTVINLNNFANWFPEQIEKHWQRKGFKDFDYLDVEITPTQLTWLMILIALYNIGVAIWIIRNQFNNHN